MAMGRADDKTGEYEHRNYLFGELLANKPKPGEVLAEQHGRSVTVYWEEKPDSGRGPTYLLWVNAMVDPEATGWYLSDGERGLKCVFDFDEKERLIYDNGGQLDGIRVKKIRVLRRSGTGNTLICEVEDGKASK